jgi:hypothetical protein
MDIWRFGGVAACFPEEVQQIIFGAEFAEGRTGSVVVGEAS